MKNAITQFTAEVSRSKDWWLVNVPQLDRVYTQVKSLSQVEDMVTEVIELVHDLDPSTFTIEVKVQAQDIVGDQFEQFLTARDAQMAAVENSIRATHQLAVRLVNDEGLTQADAGSIMGLSAQRISQILNGEQPAMEDV